MFWGLGGQQARVVSICSTKLFFETPFCMRPIGRCGKDPRLVNLDGAPLLVQDLRRMSGRILSWPIEWAHIELSY